MTAWVYVCIRNVNSVMSFILNNYLIHSSFQSSSNSTIYLVYKRNVNKKLKEKSITYFILRIT